MIAFEDVRCERIASCPNREGFGWQRAVFSVLSATKTSDRYVDRGTYRNTLSLENQLPYLTDIATEQQLENIIRWNAEAMVLCANDIGSHAGGYIATYASADAPFEVGFNSIFPNRSSNYGGHIVVSSQPKHSD